MTRVWVCFGRVWNDDKNDYVGGKSKGFDVNVGITDMDFSGEVYRISCANPSEFDL